MLAVDTLAKNEKIMEVAAEARSCLEKVVEALVIMDPSLYGTGAP